MLLYAGIGMFVCKHFWAQSYGHMIDLDDVAPKIAATLGWKRRDDDVTAHIILPSDVRVQCSVHTYSNVLAWEPHFVCS